MENDERIQKVAYQVLPFARTVMDSKALEGFEISIGVGEPYLALDWVLGYINDSHITLPIKLKQELAAIIKQEDKEDYPNIF